MKRMIGLAALTAAISLLAGTAWADKSYRVNFATPVSMAGTPVDPGEYDVVIDQSEVRLRDVDTGKIVGLKAEIVPVDRKYNHTAVVSSRTGEKIEVTEVQLGGAKMRVVFPKGTGVSR